MPRKKAPLSERRGMALGFKISCSSEDDLHRRLRYTHPVTRRKTNLHSHACCHQLKSPSLIVLPPCRVQTPPPVRSLKHSLRGYNGGDLKAMSDFVYNKERLLSACDLGVEAFEKVKTIAEGHGRRVELVRHLHTDLTLIQKVIRYERESHKVLKVELDLLHECHSPEIVNFYGSFFHGSDVHILLEYMNGGCLEDVLQRVGRIDELPLAHITRKVVHGLAYLDDSKILHRDLKPGNVLVNTKGDVKLCDFGVSKKLLTVEKTSTFVGTLAYMAPERLRADEYNAKSDIWSLGISLIELATGTYPFAEDFPDHVVPMVRKRQPTDEAPPPTERRVNLAFMDVLSAVSAKKLPKLPERRFSDPFENFIASCLAIKPKDRADLASLLRHPWVQHMCTPQFDMGAWVSSTMDPKDVEASLEFMMDEEDDEVEEECAVRVDPEDMFGE